MAISKSQAQRVRDLEARRAHNAYMAAKQAWDINTASSVVNNTASNLWVSRQSNAYNTAMTNAVTQTVPKNTVNTSSVGSQNTSNGQTTPPPVNTTTPNKPIDTSNITDVKVQDIIPKFWYETTMAERQDRNAKIADALFTNNKTLNESKLYNEISTLAPDVTQWEVMHTVNDIKNRFWQLKRYDDISGMTTDWIVAWVMNGSYSMSDLSQLQANDPAKYAEINSLIEQQRNLANNNATLDSMNALFWDDKTATAFDSLDALNEKYKTALEATDWEDALNTYQDALNSQELIDDRDQLTEKTGRVKELDELLNWLKRDVEDEFGSNAGKSLIASVVADRWANLIREKNSLMIELDTLGNKVQNAVSNAEMNYKLDLQQEQINRDNLISEYWMEKDVWDKQYAAMEKQMDKQEKIELAKLSMLEQMDIASLSDTQIDSLGAANWVKDLLKFKKWIEWSTDKKYNMALVDGKMVFYDDYGNVKDSYDPATPTANIRWTAGWDEMRTDRNNNPTALMYTTWVENFFKNRGYDVKKWDKFPNSNNYTLDMSNVSDPVKATIDYIDAYGFDYKWQHRRTHTYIPDEKWDAMSYPEKQDVVKLMYSREWGSGKLFGESASSTGSHFDETLAPYFIKALNPWGNKLTTADYKAIKDMWIDSKDFMQQAYNYKTKQDQKMKPAAQELVKHLTEIKTLLTDWDWDWLDMQNFRAGTPLTNGREINNLFKQVLASESLQNLIDLKAQWATFGALSDSELNFITSMATHLDKRSSKDEFLTNLNEEITKLNRWIDSAFGWGNTDTWNPFDTDNFLS